MNQVAQPGHVRPEDVFAQLTGYQHALAGHVDWLQRWYSALVNPHGPAPAEGAVADCPVEQWCAQAPRPFSDFPGFADLRLHHDALHAHADEIAARAAAGHTVTTTDYESMIQLVIAFGAAAQALEREAWTVLATVDPLTGLTNRQSMRGTLVRERDRALRLGQPCCLALVDIDHFKKINDSFGHLQGDKVLRAVAELLRATMRPYDTIYRYGGEEFLLCLPGTDLTIAAQVCERIRREIAELDIRTDGGEPIPVTATLGLSQMHAAHAVDDSVEQADKALYDGKRGGRNRVVVHREE